MEVKQLLISILKGRIRHIYLNNIFYILFHLNLISYIEQNRWCNRIDEFYIVSKFNILDIILSAPLTESIKMKKTSLKI